MQSSLVVHWRSVDECLAVLIEEEIIVQVQFERWHVSTIEIVKAFWCAHLRSFNREIEAVSDENQILVFMQ